MYIQRELKNDLTSIGGVIETQDGTFIPLSEVERLLLKRIKEVETTKVSSIELSEDELRGLFLILCGVPYNHSGAEVNSKALPLMDKARKKIIDMGNSKNMDGRGGDL